VTMNSSKLNSFLTAKWFVPVLLISTSPMVQCQKIDEFSEGTCAVFLQNGKNLAFVVDSAMTLTIDGVRANKTELTCKAWLPNPGMIAVTTGLLDSPSYFLSWNANTSGKSWTQSLPPEPSPVIVDTVLRGWGQELMNYLAVRPNRVRRPDGEVSSLVVAFRSGGKSFFYKERIQQHEGKVSRDEFQSIRWPLHDEGSARLYSGSCRAFIRFNNVRDVEITPGESSAMDRLVEESGALQITSAQRLGFVANRLEALSAQISQSHKSDPRAGDDIGPPFQSAILSEGTSQWIVNFSSPCP
jgi:hypothetical protein